MASKPTKAELEAIAKRFADPAFREAFNGSKVIRAREYHRNPEQWAKYATEHGPVVVLDEAGRHVVTLSVPREEKPTEREAALEAALSAFMRSAPPCEHRLRWDQEERAWVYCGHMATRYYYGEPSSDDTRSYFCDDHSADDYGRSDCWWADAAREAARLLAEGGG